MSAAADRVPVIILGGRFDHARGSLVRTPDRIALLGDIYHRLDDPDTGEFLGAYCLAPAVAAGERPDERGEDR